MYNTKILLQVLSKKPSDQIPIWLMRQAGRYLPEYREIRKNTKGFLDLCYNPDLACEVTLQPIRRFNLDGAIIFSDILVVPDAMGINVSFKENEGPVLEQITNKEDFKKTVSRKNIKKLDNVYEAIKKTKKELPENVTLIGFSGAAWTLAAYIIEGKISRDLSKIKSIYYNDKEFFEILIESLVENISQHLINQIKSGVEIIQIFDSWAGLLIGKDYKKLVIEPTQKIIKNVRDVFPNVPIICFPRMSGINYKNFCMEVDCDAISVDQYLPIEWILKYSNNKIIQGNLDPLVLLSDSTDLIRERVDEILESTNGKNFIFNLGHGVVPNIPIENVEFLVNYVKSKRFN